MIRPFAISNLAWPAESDAEALVLAAKLGFRGVELAPAKVLGPLSGIRQEAAMAYRARCADLGLEVCSLQSLFFGEEGIHLFRSDAERSRLADLLETAADLAAVLGARTCVFGAPNLRDPGEFHDDHAFELALAFFVGVSPVFAERGVTLAFEANPAAYGCRFATHTEEARYLVAAVQEHCAKGVGLQLDTGTVFMNGEPDAAVAAAFRDASHFHASEPSLAPLGSSGVDHARIGRLLSRSRYDGWVSAEMKPGADWWRGVAEARRTLADHYG
jgi:sugar phosphate isomerase/epimerase